MMPCAPEGEPRADNDATNQLDEEVSIAVDPTLIAQVSAALGVDPEEVDPRTYQG